MENSTEIEVVSLKPEQKVAQVRLRDAILFRGYVYRCEPSGDAIDALCDEDGQEHDVGFHGTGAPPCAAEYLADLDSESGYLVISADDDHESIAVVDGWVLTPATDLENGQLFDDGTWSLVVVKQHGRDHEYTVAGSL